ncbi:hypothetical protein DKG71_00795 [Streptomyces sp. NEAU-S7GS2]|nr:hypothetical protein DKG71_00795 [Streptomyces sp. NEAU-S7GS2]
MSEPVDPRLAYSVTSGPTPSPTPGPTPDPDPQPSPPGPAPEPEPTPSPSGPHLPPPWGTDPDVGVSPSFLRGRAEACDVASETIRKTRGVAEDANEDLGRAASGWSFVKSIDDMQERWEALVEEVTGRLDYASDSFRRSADAYVENESQIQSSFANIYR